MKRLAITKTVIPLDYDPTPEGFNMWAIEVRNQVHVGDNSFDAYTIIPEANKVLKFHKTIKP